MNVTWEVIRRHDSSYDILRDGTIVDAGIPEGWLEEQLVRYGFCGQEYADILGKCNKSGEAEFEFSYPFDRSRRV
jgi:hypothetical protein